MATTGTYEHGDMERLVANWRKKDWDLRSAVSTALRLGTDLKPTLPSRGSTRILPVFEQKIVYSEGPTGVLLVTLILWEEPSYQGMIEVVAKHFREHSAGLLRAINKARPKASPGKLSSSRLQVVMPPDEYINTPAAIDGVLVSWFRWVPDDEHILHVEEIQATATAAAHSSSSTSPPTIERILGHLAWWKNTIESGASSERPVRQVLLVNNAAALLEWHVRVLGACSGEAPGLPARAPSLTTTTRTAAGTLARDFADTTQEALARARKPDGTFDETKAKKSLRALPGALQKLLEGMEGLLGVTTVRPERVMEFEEPLKPGKLIEDAAAMTRRPEAQPGSEKTALTGPGAFVLHALLPAIAAERLADQGELSREALAAVRKECAGWLEDAIEIAATESKGAERKRWQALGEPLVTSWLGSGRPGDQEAGA
jgi:hypothetical protein